jgi:cell growth-regulating nucleolar protein
MNDTREHLDDDVRKVLDVVIRHENIPRKKPKFVNFVKNIIRGIRPATIDKTWEVFEEAHKSNADKNGSAPHEEKPRAEENGKKKQAEEEDGDGAQVEERMGVQMFKGLKPTGGDLEVNGKSKKRKATDDGSDDDCPNGDAKRVAIEEEESEEKPTGGRFDWEETITEILRKKGEMKLNKLKKRVVDEYISQVNTHRTQAELLARVDKKLKKNKCFKVLQDRVALVNRE